MPNSKTTTTNIVMTKVIFGKKTHQSNGRRNPNEIDTK